jgi:hypothetical protein
MRLNARVERGNFDAAFSDYYRFAEQRAERAALIATKKGARIAVNNIRSAMQSAALGRLGNAIKDTSDADKGRIHRYPNGGFSASGVVFVRSKSERTLGAIEAYTQGADIKPVRGRWLWIATDALPRVTGKFRMTPELYMKNGFDRKIGPLIRIRSVNGYPLLAVKNVGVSEAGMKRSAKSLTKAGYPRKGQVQRELVVLFIGIPRTSRAARVDVPAIMRSVAAELPALFYEALGRI